MTPVPPGLMVRYSLYPCALPTYTGITLKAAMAKLHIDRRFFLGSEKKWVSFESNPTLEKTRGDIYGRCAPCIMNLYEQLREGKGEINLGTAYRCWKVVVLLNTIEECLDVLAEFERDFLGERPVKGRFGSGDETKSTKVIVFSAESDIEKDRLYSEVTVCAVRVNPEAKVSFHRACAELYHELLGDWKEWKETETIKRPEMVKPIIERIRNVLFWEKERGL
jgi:hypothetical protein